MVLPMRRKLRSGVMVITESCLAPDEIRGLIEPGRKRLLVTRRNLRNELKTLSRERSLQFPERSILSSLTSSVTSTTAARTISSSPFIAIEAPWQDNANNDIGSASSTPVQHRHRLIPNPLRRAGEGVLGASTHVSTVSLTAIWQLWFRSSW